MIINVFLGTGPPTTPSEISITATSWLVLTNLNKWQSWGLRKFTAHQARPGIIVANWFLAPDNSVQMSPHTGHKISPGYLTWWSPLHHYNSSAQLMFVRKREEKKTVVYTAPVGPAKLLPKTPSDLLSLRVQDLKLHCRLQSRQSAILLLSGDQTRPNQPEIWTK